jgi:hypothetical protein
MIYEHSLNLIQESLLHSVGKATKEYVGNVLDQPMQFTRGFRNALSPHYHRQAGTVQNIIEKINPVAKATSKLKKILKLSEPADTETLNIQKYGQSKLDKLRKQAEDHEEVQPLKNKRNEVNEKLNKLINAKKQSDEVNPANAVDEESTKNMFDHAVNLIGKVTKKTKDKFNDIKNSADYISLKTDLNRLDDQIGKKKDEIYQRSLKDDPGIHANRIGYKTGLGVAGLGVGTAAAGAGFGAYQIKSGIDHEIRYQKLKKLNDRISVERGVDTYPRFILDDK